MSGLAEPIVTMSEAQAYVRIETGEEEALLAGLIRTASGLCEAFLNQVVIARPFAILVPPTSQWERIPIAPVKSFSEVSSLDATGTATPLPANSYQLDIDSVGDGWIRIVQVQYLLGQLPMPDASWLGQMDPADGSLIAAQAAGAPRVQVSGIAGLASEQNDVPEPIRQGVLRLVAHLFTARDGNDAEPPAAVTALWRPYRRMRLA